MYLYDVWIWYLKPKKKLIIRFLKIWHSFYLFSEYYDRWVYLVTWGLGFALYPRWTEKQTSFFSMVLGLRILFFQNLFSKMKLDSNKIFICIPGFVLFRILFWSYIWIVFFCFEISIIIRFSFLNTIWMIAFYSVRSVQFCIVQ